MLNLWILSAGRQAALGSRPHLLRPPHGHDLHDRRPLPEPVRQQASPESDQLN